MNNNASQRAWEPKEGDEYYTISNIGSSCKTRYDTPHLDQRTIAQGNAFQSDTEAQNEVKRRSVMWKMKKLADGFVPDWSGHNPPKHFITYSNNLKQWVADYTGMYQAPNTIYFASHEAAQNAIDTLGDELMVLL